MVSPENDTRTVFSLRTGTKICLLVAIPLVAVAAYFLFVPITIPGNDGAFKCSTAFNPPTDNFPKNVCGTINQAYQLRAGLLLATAAALAVLGFVLFGVDRTTETRLRRSDTDDTD